MSYGDFNKNTVVGEGDLASQLTWLQPSGLFWVGRLWIKGQSKASQKNQGPDLKDQEGDGVPRQKHRGENLPEDQVPDWGCRRYWGQFYWLNWFSVRSCANLFSLQWNRMVFSCAVSRKTKLKFRIYRCHPVKRTNLRREGVPWPEGADLGEAGFRGRQLHHAVGWQHQVILKQWRIARVCPKQKS